MLRKRGRRHLHRRRIRALIADIKRAGRCGICGSADPAKLTFHHLPWLGPKGFDLADAPRKSTGAVRAELRRCSLVCTACHAGIHTDQVDGSGLVPVEV